MKIHVCIEMVWFWNHTDEFVRLVLRDNEDNYRDLTIYFPRQMSVLTESIKKARQRFMGNHRCQNKQKVRRDLAGCGYASLLEPDPHKATRSTKVCSTLMFCED